MSNVSCDIIEKIKLDPRSIAWDAVKNDLIKHYGQAAFISWFSKVHLLESSAHSITLAVPTNFIRDWIKSNYFATIRQLFMHYDSAIRDVDLITIDNLSESHSVQSDYSLENISSTNLDAENKEKDVFNSPLDPRFTFDNFVVGSSNQLAYAAALAVAESKDAISESNPLFLYGGVGLGKTHLMHAIALYIQKNHPKRKVIYMSAEKFMYQFVRALRNKDIISFKERFRSVDVLMIDDIQFICGKDSTQEEFFHTFNALIDNNRQMVISCDRSPSDLNDIEERVKSRLGWGLVADVHSTTYELRIGILESKIEQMNINIPRSVIEFLADKITSNVRELEGALNKVIAHSTLIGREITIDNTKEILKDLLRSSERIVNIDDIQKKVASRYNIKISDMSSSSRSREVARPRQIAMYLCKILTPKSLSEIGKKFGKRDHTTIIHAVRTIEKLMIDDKEIAEEVDLLIRMLQA
jgi:chromosomal replication initiator protein